jgi:hypothetical protein
MATTTVQDDEVSRAQRKGPGGRGGGGQLEPSEPT